MMSYRSVLFRFLLLASLSHNVAEAFMASTRSETVLYPSTNTVLGVAGHLDNIDSSPPPPKRQSFAPFRKPTAIPTLHEQQQQEVEPVSAAIQELSTWKPEGKQPKGNVFTVQEPTDLIDFLRQDNVLCVVKVWATWCKTCKTFDLKWRQFAKKEEGRGRVRFAEIEFTANEELCRGLKATKLPHILIYKGMIKQTQFVCLPHDFKMLVEQVNELADDPQPPTKLP
jgi:thiol-disulfide isomerase/thioredoxin